MNRLNHFNKIYYSLYKIDKKIYLKFSNFPYYYYIDVIRFEINNNNAQFLLELIVNKVSDKKELKLHEFRFLRNNKYKKIIKKLYKLYER